MLKRRKKLPVELSWSYLQVKKESYVAILFRKYSAPYDYWHRHDDYYEFVFVLSGSAVNEMENGHFPISAGDVFLMPAGSVHHYVSMNKFQNYVIMINPEFIPTLSAIFKAMPNFKTLFRNESSIPEILHVPQEKCVDVIEKIERAQAEYHNRSFGWQEAFYIESYRIFAAILRYAQPVREEPFQGMYQIVQVVRYLEKNLQKEHSLKELSVVANMSVSNFRFLFRKIMGFSPIEYLLRLRLKQAALQMIHTDMRISEIIAQVGFSDNSYFTRQFHALFGETPTEFRKSIRSETDSPAEKISLILRK